jgi:uncharacterized protein (DUF362 family)
MEPGLCYPDADDAFCPGEHYPEYPFNQIASRPNRVYAAVRRIWAQAGLDTPRYGTTSWNPLGVYIQPGDNVFILCNFVHHRKAHESVEAFSAKCTHGSVLRAVADYALIAAGPTGRVEFGNAPIQATNWERVLRETGAAAMADFYHRSGAAIVPRDLRMFVSGRSVLGGVTSVEERSTDEEVVEIDLGSDSLLASLPYNGPARFRVADYDPRRTEKYHAAGRHVYAVNRRVLAADVVISVPKLKTHEKVGITCGLKGLVGAIALKDCLAHHRRGAPDRGGDEFPRECWTLQVISSLHEWVFRRAPNAPAQNLLHVLDRNLRRVVSRSGGTFGGAWHGNDTAWRMALDIARILAYANAQGEMTETRQRKHVVLIDGIIGGDGEGPLSPSPVASGILLFSDDLAIGDRAAATFMGYCPERLPIVREAFTCQRYPLAASTPDQANIIVNSEPTDWKWLSALRTHPFRAPRGWRGWIEAEPSIDHGERSERRHGSHAEQ